MRSNILLAVCVVLASCQGPSSEKSQSNKNFSIESRAFGKLPSGEEVTEYTLTNPAGIEMSVINYGGIIRTLKVPDRNGSLDDIVLGYENLQGYLDASPYFGAIIGRYGNRIANGKFELDGTNYQLATNNDPNHLHGGVVGFDKVIWLTTPMQSDHSVGLEMIYQSPDGEEGYPGTLTVKVTYRLTDKNELFFEYEATTDKKTIVNLTNHAYYNLTGQAGNILGHQLMLNADNYLPVDPTLIPTQITEVAGTPFDFTSFKSIGEGINADEIQIINGKGYDHCWVLNDDNQSLNLAAAVIEPNSGRRMDIYTSEPGIQFYSGNFLDGSITGKNDVVYDFRSGFCLETQHFPDSPNRPDFPTVELSPGEIYQTLTMTKFSVE